MREALERWRAWLAQLGHTGAPKQHHEVAGDIETGDQQEAIEDKANTASAISEIAEPRRTLTMSLQVTKCEITPTTIMVFFSDAVDNTAKDLSNYTLLARRSSVFKTPTKLSSVAAKAEKIDAFNVVQISLDEKNRLVLGDEALLSIDGVRDLKPTPSVNITRVNGDANEQTKAVQDAVAYPVLTEQVSFPTSAAPAPGGAATYGTSSRTGASLGQVAASAITDVLGWKTNPADPKSFIGALSQSFTLQDVEGHVEATWVPRTYAVQTDIGGGITGAQASLYTRAKDALDQSLPLLDGLYPLDPDADPEYVKALREMVRSQMTEIVKELGTVGGPSILRVNTYFGILLGQHNINFPPNGTHVQFDPDKIQGTLGQLRDTYGIYFLNNPFSNSVEDEQDITNFRVISDYMTSLLQSWISNGQFFQLGSTQPNFFGTQLVLLSRQFSVIGETVSELRFALDSVFIGPSERQTLLLQFDDSGLPAIFLEDLLREIESFAAEEGPRLLQDGGRISVTNNLIPVVKTYRHMVEQAHRPKNLSSLPDGYRTIRVQRAIDDLHDQLKELINLAIPVSQQVPPPVQEPQEGFSVLNVAPNSAKAGTSLPVSVMGAGFKTGMKAHFVPTSVNAPSVTTNATAFLSENLAVAQITISSGPGSTHDVMFTYNVSVSNPDGTSAKPLQNGFTVIVPASTGDAAKPMAKAPATPVGAP